MPTLTVLALEWLVSGAFVTFLGALIKFGGWTWLLAGYSQSNSQIPDEVVRDMAGNTILRIGSAVIGFGIFASLSDPPSYLRIVVGAMIVVAVGRLLYRINTWTPSQAA